MYFYTALYYFVTALSLTASEIVFSANIADFRSIAKQFVPDGLRDTILKMVKDTISHDGSKQLNDFPKFRDVGDDSNIGTESYNTENTVKSFFIETKASKNSMKKKTTSKYELSLDDIVDKIKKRLKNELSIMAATANAGTTTEKPYKTSKEPIDNYEKSQSTVLGNGELSRYINSPSRYMKQTRNDLNNKSQENEEAGRKSQQEPKDDYYVTQKSNNKVSKGKVDQEKPKSDNRLSNHKAFTSEHNINNQKHIKRIKKSKQPKRITSTVSDIFSAENLALKDSYEDYVIPKKDKDYFEAETKTTTPKNANMNNYFSKKDQLDKKVLNIFSDEVETTTKTKEFNNYEDETTNYNKRKKIRKSNPSLKQKENKIIVENLPYKVAVNIGQEIQPFREESERDNVQKKDYSSGKKQPVVETSKAKGGEINKEYVTSDVRTLKQRNRFEVNVRQTENYDNRSRDANNFVKIHKLHQKYNADESTQNEEQ